MTPEQRFVAALVALLAAAVWAAFARGSRRGRLAGLVGGALGVGLLLLVTGAGLAGAAAGGLLTLGLSSAAAGLAALGRAGGAGMLGAGAGALLVTVLASTGLFWADPLAERLPWAARRSLRQAVLYLDPATALAYDAAGFDRLLHMPIYAQVPLASSTFHAPRALSCALAWGAVGALCAAAAGLLARRGTPSNAP